MEVKELLPKKLVDEWCEFVAPGAEEEPPLISRPRCHPPALVDHIFRRRLRLSFNRIIMVLDENRAIIQSRAD
jgi:hypothetical protein